MADFKILRQGEFVTQDGCIIRVTIEKLYDIHTSGDLSFDATGGKGQVSIWSSKGNAVLSSDYPGWLSYQLVKTEPVPGTNWNKYTYDITCLQNNSGEERKHNWVVRIDEGEGAGVASKFFRIIQSGESAVGSITVYPTTINANNWGTTATIMVNYIGGQVVPNITYPGGAGGWVNMNILDYPDAGVVRYNVNISRNTGDARSAVITFSGTYGTATTTIYQPETTTPDMTEISVSPDHLIFGEAGGSGSTTVTYTGNDPSYSFYGGSWLSASLYDRPQSGQAVYMVYASPNSAGTQRFATLTFSDNTGGVADIYISQSGITRTLEAIPNEVFMAYNGFVRSFRVNYTGVLSDSIFDGSWFSYSSISSGSGYMVYSLYSGSYNSSSEERTGTIQFTDAMSTIQVPVIQESFGTVWMGASEITFGNLSESSTLTMVLPSQYSLLVYTINYDIGYSGSNFVRCSIPASLPNPEIPDYRLAYVSVYRNDTGQDRHAEIVLVAMDGYSTVWSSGLNVIQLSRGR